MLAHTFLMLLTPFIFNPPFYFEIFRLFRDLYYSKKLGPKNETNCITVEKVVFLFERKNKID
jgi:hypothetical protein